MKTIEVSANLADILRERIDKSTNYKRTAEIDKKIVADHNAGRPLSEKQTEALANYLYGKFLRLFLDARETLIIPDEAQYRLASELRDSFNQLGITYRYEEFYAYQFVDKLDDIVRRARRVRDVFGKRKSSQNVTALCREAYQAYVNGHFTASVALVRSLIEATVKNQLKVEVGEFYKLNDLALQNGVYTKSVWQKIDQIRRSANTIIHGAARGKTAAETETLRLIGLTQEVLQAIHA